MKNDHSRVCAHVSYRVMKEESNNKSERRTLLIEKEVKINFKSELPEHEIDALAKCFLPDILDYFNSEEGGKEFEEWKKKQNNKDSDE
ncbi:MAG: hypothetical protein E7599_07645 [Ruminococcaceae bacterium]|nr:hypothetical protein [Oscillospiraceae bacterium]